MPLDLDELRPFLDAQAGGSHLDWTGLGTIALDDRVLDAAQQQAACSVTAETAPAPTTTASRRGSSGLTDACEASNPKTGAGSREAYVAIGPTSDDTSRARRDFASSSMFVSWHGSQVTKNCLTRAVALGRRISE